MALLCQTCSFDLSEYGPFSVMMAQYCNRCRPGSVQFRDALGHLHPTASPQPVLTPLPYLSDFSFDFVNRIPFKEEETGERGPLELDDRHAHGSEAEDKPWYHLLEWE